MHRENKFERECVGIGCGRCVHEDIEDAMELKGKNISETNCLETCLGIKDCQFVSTTKENECHISKVCNATTGDDWTRWKKSKSSALLNLTIYGEYYNIISGTDFYFMAFIKTYF